MGDSFVIRDGRLAAAPIKANTLRINDNIDARARARRRRRPRTRKATAVWAADEVVYAPEIAVSGVHVDAIAASMEDPR